MELRAARVQLRAGFIIPRRLGKGGGQSDSGSDGSQFGGGVITINRQGFIKAYADMVARTWTDDSSLDLILSDTANALSKVGIPTVPGAVIKVIEHRITGSGKSKIRWMPGWKATGRVFTIYFCPLSRMISTPRPAEARLMGAPAAAAVAHRVVAAHKHCRQISDGHMLNARRFVSRRIRRSSSIWDLRGLYVGLVQIGEVVWERRPSRHFHLVEGALRPKPTAAVLNAASLAYLPQSVALLQAYAEQYASGRLEFSFLPILYKAKSVVNWLST